MPKAAAGPMLSAFSGFDLIKQYPAEEQVRLKVVIDVPGSWFGAGQLGSLSASERKDNYTAQAVEYSDAHHFGSHKRSAPWRRLSDFCA